MKRKSQKKKTGVPRLFELAGTKNTNWVSPACCPFYQAQHV